MSTDLDIAHRLLDENRAAEALAWLDAQLALPCQDDRWRAEAHGLAAVAARSEPSRARVHFERAELLFGEPADDDGRARLAAMLEDYAELELACKASDRARSLLRTAIRLHRDPPAETWLALAEAELRAGFPEAAEDAADRAAAVAEDDYERALAAELRADALRDRERVAESDAAYAEAARRWQSLDDAGAYARCLLRALEIADVAEDEARIATSAALLESLVSDDPEVIEARIAAREILLARNAR